MGPIHSLVMPPPYLTEPVRHLVDPIKKPYVKGPVKGPCHDTNAKVP